jgi:hypothetical protein
MWGGVRYASSIVIIIIIILVFLFFIILEVVSFDTFPHVRTRTWRYVSLAQHPASLLSHEVCLRLPFDFWEDVAPAAQRGYSTRVRVL